jgi:type 1 fimbria pilin
MWINKKRGKMKLKMKCMVAVLLFYPGVSALAAESPSVKYEITSHVTGGACTFKTRDLTTYNMGEINIHDASEITRLVTVHITDCPRAGEKILIDLLYDIAPEHDFLWETGHGNFMLNTGDGVGAGFILTRKDGIWISPGYQMAATTDSQGNAQIGLPVLFKHSGQGYRPGNIMSALTLQLTAQ